jgi:hypothetical protein
LLCEGTAAAEGIALLQKAAITTTKQGQVAEDGMIWINPNLQISV